MFRNSVFDNLMQVKEALTAGFAQKETPIPLTKEELDELETYRDEEGYLDFSKVKDRKNLLRLVELVDRKNAIEEMNERKTQPVTLQEHISELIDELLPIMGLHEANLKVSTPAGTASINVKQGEKPVVVYDTNDKNEGTNLSYTVTAEETVEPETDDTEDSEDNFEQCAGCPDRDTCELRQDMNKDDAEQTEEKRGVRYVDQNGNLILDVPAELTDQLILTDGYVKEKDEWDDDYDYESVYKKANFKEGENPFDFDGGDQDDGNYTVVLSHVGGWHNPAYMNAAHYICEKEHFPLSGVYKEDDIIPENVDIYIAALNPWDKMTECDAQFFEKKMEDGAKIFTLDSETFELNPVIDSDYLYDYVMTEAQLDTLR